MEIPNSPFRWDFDLQTDQEHHPHLNISGQNHFSIWNVTLFRLMAQGFGDSLCNYIESTYFSSPTSVHKDGNPSSSFIEEDFHRQRNMMMCNKI